MEAKVLQQKHVAGSEVTYGGLHVRPNAVVGGAHLRMQKLGEAAQHGGESHILHHLAAGPTQVGAQDDLRPLLLEVADCWNGGADAAVVRDAAVLQGHVEVNPHQDALAADLYVPDALLLHGSSGGR